MLLEIFSINLSLTKSFDLSVRFLVKIFFCKFILFSFFIFEKLEKRFTLLKIFEQLIDGASEPPGKIFE